MRGLRFFLILLTVILFCSQASAFTASYEQTTEGAQLPGPQSRSVKIKDDKVRMEMETPQGKGIMIIDGNVMYSYMPSRNEAVKLVNKSSFGTEVLSDYSAYLKSLDAKVVGSEKIDKYNCDIYEFIDPRFNMASKVWLWKEKEFPVKVETKIPDGAMTSTMKNIQIGINIDDSEFVLPKGVKILSPSQLNQ